MATQKIGLEAVFATAEFARGVSRYLGFVSTVEKRTDEASKRSSASFGILQGAVMGVSAAVTDHLINALTAAGRAVTHALSDGISEAADLEQQLDGIRSVISITDAQAEKLTDTMFDIALDPTVQASVFDVADAMDIAARAGARFDDIVGGLTRNILVLANATAGDYRRAADILTSAQIVWGLSIEETTQAVNDITAAVNSSKLSLDDYRFSMSNAGGVAEIAGVNFSDFNKIMAAAVPAFSGGRRAGQGFASFLSSTIPISKRQTQAFRELGLITFDLERGFSILRQNGIAPLGHDMETVVPQLYSLAESMGFVTKDGAAGAKQFQDWAKSIGLFNNALYDTNGDLLQTNELVGTLRAALQGLSSEKQIELATAAFGREGMDFAIALANVDPTRLAELNAEFAKTNAADIAALRMDNFRGALEQMQDTVHALTTQVGLELLPTLTDVIRLFTAGLAANAEEVVGFFEKVGVATQGFVAALMAGEPPLEAFVEGLGDLMFALNYSGESIRTVEAIILRLSEILNGIFSAGAQFAAENALALEGALRGLLIGVSVASAIAAIAGAIAMLTSPVGLLLAASAALGAAWQTDFLGMRTAVLWFWEQVQPVFYQLAALGGFVMGAIRQLAADFSAGWNAMAGATNTGVTEIGRLMFSLGQIAHSWGVGLVNALASGIQAAVGAVIEAINVLGSILAYWMTPHSPPRFLPDLDKWGTGAAEAYLQGWTEADFDALTSFGNDIRQILQNMVGTGAIDEADANPLLLAVRDQMAGALDELNDTGAVSEATFAAIRAAAGEAGEEVEAFARRYLALNATVEAAAAAAEALTAANDEQAAAERELANIRERLEAGDPTVTMDEYRAALARVQAARQSVDVATEENRLAQERKTAAQREFDLFKSRMGVQNDTLSIMGQQKALMERLAALADDQAKKAKEGLTDLEKQVKLFEMMQAHYNDRIRLAELDNILADEKATATEKASAEIEKQLILARMAQREFEASELGFDLSGVYELPIVFEEAEKKAKGVKGAASGLADAMGTLPGIAGAWEEAMSGVDGVLDGTRTKVDEIKGSFDSLKESLGTVFGGLGRETFEIPFLDDLREFRALLETPITLPSFDFGAIQPPEWFTSLMSGGGGVLGGIGESISAAFGGLSGGVEWEGLQTELEPFHTLLVSIGARFQELGTRAGEAFSRVQEAFSPIGEQLAALEEAWRPALDWLAEIFGWILPRAIGGLAIILGGIFAIALGLVSAIIDGVITGLEILGTALSMVTTGILAVITGIGNVVSGIINLLSADSWAEVVAGFQQIWDGIVQIVAGLVITVISALAGMVGVIIGLVWGFVDGIIKFFQGLYDELVGHSIIPDLVNEIVEWFNSLDDQLWNIVNQMWLDLQSMFETAKSNLLTTVTNLIRDIVSKFTTENWGKLGRDLVYNIADGIVNNLGRIGQAARELVGRLINSAISAITNALGGGGGTQPTANDPNTGSGGSLPGNAKGTNYWRGGLTWVGEQGAELVSLANRAFLADRKMVLDLPRGTQIFNAGATRALLGRQSPFGNAAPTSSTTTIHNTRNYYISSQSSPMQIDRALAVSEALSD